MGVHFVHQSRMTDATLHPKWPEILLYEPQQSDDGSTKYNLVGVEYYIAAGKVDSPPTLFDEEFDGPMPGHGRNQPRHDDLHAWVWRNNPDGVFTAQNPNVDC